MLNLIKENWFLTSAIIAVVGWFLTTRRQHLSDRAKHSHSYVNFLDEPKYLGAIKKINHYLNKKIAYLLDDAFEDDKANDAIWELLQLMELSAVDIEMGYISEAYFQKRYGTFINRLFCCSAPYINKKRRDSGSASIYANFCILYIRSAFPKRPLIQRFWEFLTIRPNFDMSKRLFAAHLNTADNDFTAFLKSILSGARLPDKVNYVEGFGMTDEPNYHKYRNRIQLLRLLEWGMLLLIARFLFAVI